MASLEPLSLTERLSRVSAPVVAVSVLIVTTVAAAFYRVLSPTGNGIVSAFSDRAPTFGDCLYFSIVTLTSLGYGDYRPVGYGRALAVTEVGFGLFTLALVVSKLASARDSTVLRMLYSSDQQRRVHDFAEYIQNMAERVTSTFRGGEAAGAMRENVKALQHALHVLLRYLRYQAHMHDFLNIQSARQLTFVFDALLGAATAAGGIANVARRYPSARAPVVTVLRLVEELAMLLTSEGAAPEPRNDL